MRRGRKQRKQSEEKEERERERGGKTEEVRSDDGRRDREQAPP